MARSDKSKIPLRGVASIFNHLDPGVKAKITSAFAEAEDLIDYHNSSIIERQTRRKLSGLIDAPILTITTNSKGFDASWPRLEDRRISFYEVQMSTSSNFADPTVFNVVETSLAVEGVGATVYIRVRGVRFDGDCGSWSEVESASASAAGGPVVYSRGLADIPSFYITTPYNLFPQPIQHLTITPQRQNGGFLIYGSFGLESCNTPINDPPVFLTLNGVNYSSTSIAEFTTVPTCNVPFGLGPIFVSHDEFYFGEQQTSTPGTAANNGAADSDGTPSGWTLTDPYTYTVTWTGSHPAEDAETKNLRLTNLGFTIPTGNTITGVYVQWTASATSSSPAADLLGLRLLDSSGARSNVVSGTGDWGNGTQSYGSRTNLWGEVDGFWTPTKVNDSSFGVQFRGNVYVPSASSGTIVRELTVSSVTVTVYSVNETTGEVNIQIRFNPGVTSGELRQCTLNAIEFGEDI